MGDRNQGGRCRGASDSDAASCEARCSGASKQGRAPISASRNPYGGLKVTGLGAMQRADGSLKPVTEREVHLNYADQHGRCILGPEHGFYSSQGAPDGTWRQQHVTRNA